MTESTTNTWSLVYGGWLLETASRLQLRGSLKGHLDPERRVDTDVAESAAGPPELPAKTAALLPP